MDQELITYLDGRFAESERHHDETTQRVAEELRQETTQQTQELRQEFQELRQETTQQIQDLRRETDERFERVDGQIRHTQVMVEDLRGDVRLIAEGVKAMNDKVDRLQEENRKSRREDRAFFTALFRNVQDQVADHGLQ